MSVGNITQVHDRTAAAAKAFSSEATRERYAKFVEKFDVWKTHSEQVFNP